MPDNESHSSESLRVLLVEDNQADAMMFSALLKERSPETELTVLSDGAEAVQRLLQTEGEGALSPHVVFLDLNLPRKNGFEVLAETRTEPRLRDLPVYLLTTSGSLDDEVRAKALGVAGFLTKAPDLDALEAMIDRLVAEEFPRIQRQLATDTAPHIVDPTPRLNDKVSSEGIRLFIDSIKDYAVFMLSPQGYVLTWNQGAERIKHYSSAEAIGRHFSIFYTSEAVKSGYPEEALRIASREGRYQGEGWRLRKDGTRFWANVTITEIRTDKGELVGFGKVTRDMTERNLEEEKLRESEERFRILVDSVRDYAIFMLDSSGHITSWNRGAERINGYSSSEVLGKHFSIFYTEQSKRVRHPEHELEMALKHGTYEEEGIRVRRDGTTFWASVVITPLYDPKHRHTGFSKVTRDITDRKRNEQQVLDLNSALEARVASRTQELEDSKLLLEIQKEELTRSNSDLQQFAYVASHDLQEPLRTVVSHLQLIERKDKANISPESRQSIEFAIQGATRLRNLVLDLLSYARIEKASENIRPTDMNDIVGDVVKQFQNRVRETGTTLTVEPLPTIQADPAQMFQLFQNLIANAISYRSGVRNPEIQVGVREGAEEWTFFVRDNGVGIDPEYWQKIFVIFQRLHRDSPEFPGTGIGLAICKKIAERHRGRIWLDSTPGLGSTFYLSLPKAYRRETRFEVTVSTSDQSKSST